MKPLSVVSNLVDVWSDLNYVKVLQNVEKKTVYSCLQPRPHGNHFLASAVYSHNFNGCHWSADCYLHCALSHYRPEYLRLHPHLQQFTCLSGGIHFGVSCSKISCSARAGTKTDTGYGLYHYISLSCSHDVTVIADNGVDRALHLVFICTGM